jgi:hypothetical protein
MRCGVQVVVIGVGGVAEARLPRCASSLEWGDEEGVRAVVGSQVESRAPGACLGKRREGLCRRTKKFGETDIGALTGRFNTTAGVRGSASRLVGEEDRFGMVVLDSRLSLVGLSKDELLMRAISASARPLRMRVRDASASEVS